MRAIVVFEASGTCLGFLTRSSGAGAPALEEVVGDGVPTAIEMATVTVPRALLEVAEVEIDAADLQAITSVRVDPNSVPPAAKTSPLLPGASLVRDDSVNLTWTGGPPSVTGRVVTSDGHVLDLPANQPERDVTLDFALGSGGSFVIFPDGFAPLGWPPLPGVE